jgi:hypothetical protein
MRRRTLAAGAPGVAAACAVAGLASLLLGGEDGRATPYRAALAPPPKPALHVGAPRALGAYETVRTRLVVDRERLTATLLRDGRPAFHAGIGVGQARSPTPSGDFYVRNRLTRCRSATYGPLAFGTSARSETLTDRPAGGFVGIHRTDQPDLLPGRVSHGCSRMRNRDTLRLGRLMGVGTPVTIR